MDSDLYKKFLAPAVKLSSTESVLKLLILAGFYFLLTGKYIILIYMLKNEYRATSFNKSNVNETSLAKVNCPS